MCPQDPVALNLQFEPLHMLQQFIDEMVTGVGYLTMFVLDLHVSRHGQPTRFFSLSWSGPVLQHCSVFLVQCSRKQEAGPVSFHALRSSLNTLTSSGPIFLPVEVVKRWVEARYFILHPWHNKADEKGMGHSSSSHAAPPVSPPRQDTGDSALLTHRPPLPQVLRGGGWKGNYFLAYSTICQMKGRAKFPMCIHTPDYLDLHKLIISWTLQKVRGRISSTNLMTPETIFSDHSM